MPTPTSPTADTPTPTPTIPPAGGPDVQIACIFFDGAVPRSESDEYVEIVNVGDAPQALEGWRLLDIADDSPEFVFPEHLLGAGESIRVYTDEVHEEWGGFSFERATAIWNNDTDDPDTAGLYDQAGELVSTNGYPPGCQ